MVITAQIIVILLAILLLHWIIKAFFPQNKEVKKYWIINKGSTSPSLPLLKIQKIRGNIIIFTVDLMGRLSNYATFSPGGIRIGSTKIIVKLERTDENLYIITEKINVYTKESLGYCSQIFSKETKSITFSFIRDYNNEINIYFYDKDHRIDTRHINYSINEDKNKGIYLVFPSLEHEIGYDISFPINYSF